MNAGRVLLTGASGFLGRAMVPALRARGFEIVAVSRRPQRDADVTWRICDLTQPDLVERVVEGVEVVINNAGDTSKADSQRSALMAVNRDAAGALARASARAGVRHFVQVSSTGVFGKGEGLFDERSPCRPNNAYEQSKLEGERAVIGEASLQMRVTVIRPSNVFGEEHPQRKLLTWLTRLSRGHAALAGDPARSWVNYVHVDDVAHAAAELAASPPRGEVSHACFIVNTPATMLSFYHASALALGASPRPRVLPAFPLLVAATGFDLVGAMRGRSFALTRDKVKEMVSRQVFSAERLRDKVPQFPYVGLDKGIERISAAYRSRGLL